MRKHQQGLSLVELMIAVTLSLIVAAALISILIQTNTTNRHTGNVGRMQENARIAMQILGADLLHATFFGESLSPTSEIDTTGYTLTEPSPDCGAGSGNAYNVGAMNELLDYSPDLTPTEVATEFTCISNADVRAANTNVLVIKRAEAAVASPAAGDNRVYVRANPTQGALYHNVSGGTLPTFTGDDWRYQAHIYYVDDELVLSREYLNSGATPAMQKEQLVEGIEQFHIEFGIDEDGDGDAVPDYYTGSPAAEVGQAVTARIYVLSRSPDPVNGYTNDKTYNLGSTTEGPFNDSYYRRVYATTVVLKNARNRMLMNDPQ